MGVAVIARGISLHALFNMISILLIQLQFHFCGMRRVRLPGHTCCLINTATWRIMETEMSARRGGNASRTCRSPGRSWHRNTPRKSTTRFFMFLACGEIWSLPQQSSLTHGRKRIVLKPQGEYLRHNIRVVRGIQSLVCDVLFLRSYLRFRLKKCVFIRCNYNFTRILLSQSEIAVKMCVKKFL